MKKIILISFIIIFAGGLIAFQTWKTSPKYSLLKVLDAVEKELEVIAKYDDQLEVIKKYFEQDPLKPNTD